MSYLDSWPHCIQSILYLILKASIKNLTCLLLFIAYLDFAAGLQEFGLSLQQGVDALLGFLELLFWRFFGGSVVIRGHAP